MFYDPFYGLGNYQNYPRWNILLPGNVNTTVINQKLAFQAEMRSYFNLTSTQMQQITNNWNTLRAPLKDLWNDQLPSPTQYQNTFGAAYWQWATGQLTQNSNLVTSIALLGNNAFAGYNEISYWHTDYFDFEANAQNVQIF